MNEHILYEVRTYWSDGGQDRDTFNTEALAKAFALKRFVELGCETVQIESQRTRITCRPIKTWSHR